MAVMMFIMSENAITMVQARQIEDFQSFVVCYRPSSNKEQYTGYLKKSKNGGKAVINLTDTNANGKTVIVTMRNDENAYRGRVKMKVGTRRTFATSGQKGYYYKLGIRKANNFKGTTAVLFGSWSPDEK